MVRRANRREGGGVVYQDFHFIFKCLDIATPQILSSVFQGTILKLIQNLNFILLFNFTKFYFISCINFIQFYCADVAKVSLF